MKEKRFYSMILAELNSRLMQQNTTGCRAIKICKPYTGYREKSLQQDIYRGYKERVRYAAAMTCTGFMVS